MCEAIPLSFYKRNYLRWSSDFGHLTRNIPASLKTNEKIACSCQQQNDFRLFIPLTVSGICFQIVFYSTTCISTPPHSPVWVLSGRSSRALRAGHSLSFCAKCNSIRDTVLSRRQIIVVGRLYQPVTYKQTSWYAEFNWGLLIPWLNNNLATLFYEGARLYYQPHNDVLSINPRFRI